MQLLTGLIVQLFPTISLNGDSLDLLKELELLSILLVSLIGLLPHLCLELLMMYTFSRNVRLKELIHLGMDRLLLKRHVRQLRNLTSKDSKI